MRRSWCGGGRTGRRRGGGGSGRTHGTRRGSGGGCRRGNGRTRSWGWSWSRGRGGVRRGHGSLSGRTRRGWCSSCGRCGCCRSRRCILHRRTGGRRGLGGRTLRRGGIIDQHDARIRRLAAARQDLGLLDPVLAGDAAFIAEQTVETLHVGRRPVCDLAEARDTLHVQQLLDLGVDPANALQIVARGPDGRARRIAEGRRLRRRPRRSGGRGSCGWHGRRRRNHRLHGLIGGRRASRRPERCCRGRGCGCRSRCRRGRRGRGGCGTRCGRRNGSRSDRWRCGASGLGRSGGSGSGGGCSRCRRASRCRWCRGRGRTRLCHHLRSGHGHRRAGCRGRRHRGLDDGCCCGCRSGGGCRGGTLGHDRSRGRSRSSRRRCRTRERGALLDSRRGHGRGRRCWRGGSCRNRSWRRSGGGGHRRARCGNPQGLALAFVRRRFGQRRGLRLSRDVGGLFAASQDLRLLDPVFLLDTPLQSERLGKPLNVGRTPIRDLPVAAHAGLDQPRGAGGIDGADFRQIVGRRGLRTNADRGGNAGITGRPGGRRKPSRLVGERRSRLGGATLHRCRGSGSRQGCGRRSWSGRLRGRGGGGGSWCRRCRRSRRGGGSGNGSRRSGGRRWRCGHDDGSRRGRSGRSRTGQCPLEPAGVRRGGDGVWSARRCRRHGLGRLRNPHARRPGLVACGRVEEGLPQEGGDHGPQQVGQDHQQGRLQDKGGHSRLLHNELFRRILKGGRHPLCLRSSASPHRRRIAPVRDRVRP